MNNAYICKQITEKSLTMKRKELCLLLIGFSLPLVFSSCSGGVDKGSGEPHSNVIATDDGQELLLMSVGDYDFFFIADYDSLCRCYTYAINYIDTCMCNISYDPCEIVAKGRELNYTLNLTFNSEGLVSKMKSDTSWDYEKWGSGNSKGESSLSYDSVGHLTEIVSQGESMETNAKGEKVSSKWKSSMTFDWAEGNLVKSKQIVEGNTKGSEGRKNVIATTTYTIEYSDTLNKYQQFTSVYDEIVQGEMEMRKLGFIGFLGKGTKNLPSSYHMVYECDTTNWERSESYSYTLNRNGTIATENDLRYTYAPVSLMAK